MPDLPLAQYLEAWHLSEPIQLATTPTSTVYRVHHNNQFAILKLLTPIGIHDEGSGAIALQHFDGNGAVHLLRHDAGAHLLEYADGDDLIEMVQRGEDEQATDILVDVLRRLHTPIVKDDANGLVSLERRFRSLFQFAAMPDQNDLYRRAAKVARTLLESPLNHCVLHGDIHHGNMIYSNQRGWLAIDPKGLWGERTYDIANILCNPIETPNLVLNKDRLLRNATIFSDELGIDRQRVLAFTYVHACLGASWSVGDGGDPNLGLFVAKIIEPYLQI